MAAAATMSAAIIAACLGPLIIKRRDDRHKRDGTIDYIRVYCRTARDLWGDGGAPDSEEFSKVIGRMIEKIKADPSFTPFVSCSESNRLSAESAFPLFGKIKERELGSIMQFIFYEDAAAALARDLRSEYVRNMAQDRKEEIVKLHEHVVKRAYEAAGEVEEESSRHALKKAG